MKKDTETKTLKTSEINKQIEELLHGTSVNSIEALLKSSDVEALHTLFYKMDKSQILHLQALIRAKKETENAVKETNKYKSINRYLIVTTVLGVVMSSVFLFFSDKIILAP